MKDCTKYVCDPLTKYCIVVVEHVNHIEGYVFCSVVVLITEGYRACDFPMAFTCLPLNRYNGHPTGCRRFMSSFMLSKVDANRMLAELPLSTRILVTAQPARFVSMTIASV